jgi:hypothetical protein
MVDDNERGFRRALIEASDHFGLDHERLEPLGGMTGRVFGIDDVVLRLGSPETIAHELAAANAASVAVPVPATVGTFVPTDGVDHGRPRSSSGSTAPSPPISTA